MASRSMREDQESQMQGRESLHNRVASEDGDAFNGNGYPVISAAN